jgi:pectate lyase
MKKNGFICLITLLLNVNFLLAQTPAFPGAEGGGQFTSGGRGGIVYEVTNLSDSGVGSLRYGIESLSGARTIVFRVSGTINMTRDIRIRNGNLTIAGQTAPGDGITLKGYPVVNQADNVIIRYLRFRVGDESNQDVDAIWGRNQKNIIIDHCTMSWGVDENSSFYDNENFTMQWCILSEALTWSVHGGGRHGFTGIWGGKQATFHHNLIASTDSRNPRFCGSRYSGQPDKEYVDFRNNVIYNWFNGSGYGGEGGFYNMVNNYYKPGPATSKNKDRIFRVWADNGVYGKFFIDGNFMEGSPSVTNNNWNGISYNHGLTENQVKSTTEIEMPYVHTQSAQDAFYSVLDNAGASFARDTVDKRIVFETLTGTNFYVGSSSQAYPGGLIDSQTDVGGWPVLHTAEPPIDTDNDGIPDEWEIANGLNPNDPEDRNLVGEDGYTMLERYLNSIEFNNPVDGLGWTKHGENSYEISWRDNYLAEDGFIIERSVNGEEYVEIARVPKYSTNYHDEHVQAEEGTEIFYRIIAFNEYNETPRTNQIGFTTGIIAPEADKINVHCFPNPFSGNLSIQISSDAFQAVNIRLFDMTGRKVGELSGKSVYTGINRFEFPFGEPGLHPGVYFCTVYFEQSRSYKSVMVVKK